MTLRAPRTLRATDSSSDAAEEARLGRDGRLAPEDGRVAEVLGVLEIAAPGLVDDDVGQAEGQGQLAGLRVEGLVAADHPVGIGDEGLVAVAAVHVDEDVGPLDDLLVEHGGDPLAHRARRVAREDAVEVLPVVGPVVDRPLLEARQVGDVDHEDRAAQGLGVDHRPQPVEREDGRVFVGVDAGDEGQDLALLRAVDDRVGDLGRGAVPARGNGQKARRGRPALDPRRRR